MRGEGGQLLFQMRRAATGATWTIGVGGANEFLKTRFTIGTAIFVNRHKLVELVFENRQDQFINEITHARSVRIGVVHHDGEGHRGAIGPFHVAR